MHHKAVINCFKNGVPALLTPSEQIDLPSLSSSLKKSIGNSSVTALRRQKYVVKTTDQRVVDRCESLVRKDSKDFFWVDLFLQSDIAS